MGRSFLRLVQLQRTFASAFLEHVYQPKFFSNRKFPHLRMELGYISAVEFSRSALYPEKLGVFRVEMKSTKHLNKAGGSSFGFSLVELLVKFGFITLFAAVSAPLLESFRAKARKAKCISYIRTIHSALLGYVTDVGHWPQMEEGEFEFSGNEFFAFWVTMTEPCGAARNTWVCPSDVQLEHMPRSKKIKYVGSYDTTRFDHKAQTPFRWNQPWVMERGSFHGRVATASSRRISSRYVKPLYGR